MVEVNQFFLLLQYLGELANQTETCLKICERIIQKDRNMGSSTHGGYSNSESGVTRLIRTAWKSVQGKGYENTGKIFYFATYLKDEFVITSISLILLLV